MNSDDKSGGTLGNFKFNTVGRTEAATEVLQPQIDPAIRTRNIIFAVIAAVILVGIVYVSFQKTGKELFAKPREGKQFSPPEHNMNGL